MKYQILALLIILLAVAQSKFEEINDQNIEVQVPLSVQKTQVREKTQSLGKEVSNILSPSQLKDKIITPAIPLGSLGVQKPTNSQENPKLSTEQLIKVVPPHEIIKQIEKKSQTNKIEVIPKQMVSIKLQSKKIDQIVQYPKMEAKRQYQERIQNEAQKTKKDKSILEPTIQQSFASTKDSNLIGQIQSIKQILKVNPVQNNGQVGFKQKVVQIAKSQEKMPIAIPEALILRKQSLQAQRGIDKSNQKLQKQTSKVLPKKAQIATINNQQVVVAGDKDSQLPLITPKIEENQQLSNKIQKPHVLITDYREYFPSIKAKTDTNVAVQQQKFTQIDSKLLNQQLKTVEMPVKTQRYEEVLPSQPQKLVKIQIKQQISNIQNKIDPLLIPLATTTNTHKLQYKKTQNIQDKQQLKQYLPIIKNKQVNSLQITKQPIVEREKLLVTSKLDQANKLPINQEDDNQVDKTILQSNNIDNLLKEQNIVSKVTPKADPVVPAKQINQNLIEQKQKQINQTPVKKQQIVEPFDIKKIVVKPVQSQSPKVVETKQILPVSKQIQPQITTIQSPKIQQLEQNQQYLKKMQSTNTIGTNYRQYFPLNKVTADINLLQAQNIPQRDIKLVDVQQKKLTDQMQVKKETNREAKSTSDTSQQQIKPISDLRQWGKKAVIKQDEVQILPQQINKEVKDIANSPQQNKIDSQKYQPQVKVLQNQFNNPSVPLKIQKQQQLSPKEQVKDLVKLNQNQQLKKNNEINEEAQDTAQSLQISHQIKQKSINENIPNQQADDDKIIIKAEQESPKSEQRIDMLENKLKQLMDMLQRQKQKTKLLEQHQKTVQKKLNTQPIDSIPQTQATQSVQQKLKEEQIKKVQTFNSQNIVSSTENIDDIKPLGQNLKAEQNNVAVKTDDLSQITPSFPDKKVQEQDSTKEVPPIQKIDVKETNTITQNVVSKETFDEIPKSDANEKKILILEDRKIQKTSQTQNINQKIIKPEVKSDAALQESLNSKVPTGEVTPISQQVVDKTQTNPISQIPLKNDKKIEQNQRQDIEQKQPDIAETKKEVQTVTKTQNQVIQVETKVQQQKDKKNQVQQRPYNAQKTQTDKRQAILSSKLQQSLDLQIKKDSDIDILQSNIDHESELKQKSQKSKAKKKRQPKKFKKNLSSNQQQTGSYDVLQQYRKLQQHKKQSIKSPVNKLKITNQPQIQKVIIQPPVIIVKPMSSLAKTIIAVLTALILVIIGKEIYHRKIAAGKHNSTQRIKQDEDFTKLGQIGIEVADRLDEVEQV